MAMQDRDRGRFSARRKTQAVVDRSGILVQLDTKQVPVGKGKVLYPFGSVDCFTRNRVVAWHLGSPAPSGRSF